MTCRRDMLKLLAAGAVLPGAALARGDVAPKRWQMPADFVPREVRLQSRVRAGEIHVLPDQRLLLWTTGPRSALRFKVAIGAGDLYRPGVFSLGDKREWPSWTPTRNMIRRHPDKYAQFAGGVPGGPDNPLGSRALYLYSGGRDTFLRIHGTPHPWTVGQAASNGCVRMINAHVEMLYDRVPIGSTIRLHPKA